MEACMTKDGGTSSSSAAGPLGHAVLKWGAQPLRARAGAEAVLRGYGTGPLRYGASKSPEEVGAGHGGAPLRAVQHVDRDDAAPGRRDVAKRGPRGQDQRVAARQQRHVQYGKVL